LSSVPSIKIFQATGEFKIIWRRISNFAMKSNLDGLPCQLTIDTKPSERKENSQLITLG